MACKKQNKIDILDGYAIIHLKPGYITFVDQADLSLIKDYKWYLSRVSPNHCYARTKRQGKTIYLHRMVMGEPDNMVVDHISHDRLDNRKSNLRVTTRQANCNHRLNYTNGAAWVRNHNTYWLVAKTHPYKRFGSFTDQKDAQILARYERARYHNQDFGQTPTYKEYLDVQTRNLDLNKENKCKNKRNYNLGKKPEQASLTE